MPGLCLESESAFGTLSLPQLPAESRGNRGALGGLVFSLRSPLPPTAEELLGVVVMMALVVVEIFPESPASKGSSLLSESLSPSLGHKSGGRRNL